MRRAIFVTLILTTVFLAAALWYNLSFSGRVWKNIYVASINIGGLKPADAAFLLSEKIQVPESIKLASEAQNFDINLKDLEVSYDFAGSSQRAFALTRTGNFFYDFGNRILLLTSGPKEVGLSVKLNEDKLSKIISVISGQISVDPVSPSVKVVNGKISLNKGKQGHEIDTNLLRANIGRSLAFAQADTLTIPLKETGYQLTDTEATELGSRAEKYIGKKVDAKFEFSNFSFSDNQILELLDPKGGYSNDAIGKASFKIAGEIERSPQNPKFGFSEGRVSEFLPAKDGIELEPEKFKEKLVEALDKLSAAEEKTISFDIPVTRTPPETTTDKVNDLGIKELIGRGTSRFRGSITSRVHNIQVASARLNGLLIKPGDIFSFNDALGDVSSFTGYQQAYVIKEGKTVLGDGGGVCQVSTTFFRAALNAGLPIVERQAHAYRVGYYEQDAGPGLDATVYGPTPDLKIKNDTPAHILIQAKVDPKYYSLVFEFYGTSDGRVATTSKPVITDVVQPGEDLYIDDPTLPAGTVKQTEHKANGAKVTFNYKVERGGVTVYSKKFISNYRPWQAVYLRGTAPAN